MSQRIISINRELKWQISIIDRCYLHIVFILILIIVCVNRSTGSCTPCALHVHVVQQTRVPGVHDRVDRCTQRHLPRFAVNVVRSTRSSTPCVVHVNVVQQHAFHFGIVPGVHDRVDQCHKGS